MIMALPKIKKLYYSIREVSKMTDVPQPTLRYWENEFPLLQPGKNSAGNRIYKLSDIKIIFFIKHLLYTQKLTINGANEIIQQLHDKNELTSQLDRFTPDNDSPVSLDERKKTAGNEDSPVLKTQSGTDPAFKTLLYRIREELNRINAELDKIRENLN